MIVRPRQIQIRMTEPARMALDAFLHGPWNKTTIGFGGARFGSKTHTGAHCQGIACLVAPNTKHVAIRTVLSAADLNLGEEIKKGFIEPMGLPMGTLRRDQIQYDVKKFQFKFPNGSMLQLGFCSKPNDYEQYVGTQWDSLWIEQAEHFQEKVFEQLGGSVRPSTNASAFQPRKLITFNPGGIGSEWLYRRIINPNTRDRDVIYAQSGVRNCYATLERDPGYILRELMKITDPVLREQWLNGNWDIKSGSYFRLMPDTVREIRVPPKADWYGGGDWGRDKPFAYLMMAHWVEKVSPFSNRGKMRVHVCKEVYQRYLELDEQAERALSAEQALEREYPNKRDFDMRYVDPSTSTPIPSKSTEQTRTVASVWADCGFHTYPSFRYSRVDRWELIKYLIKHGNLTIDPECTNLIREFRTAIYAKESEDLDQKKSDDHALDALAYPICAIFGLDFVEAAPSEEEKFMLRMVG